MKHLIFKKSVLFSILFLMLFSVSIAYASTPTLSVSPIGDGDSVQVNVTGDSNQSVILFYTKSGTGPTLTAIGATNANGILSTAVSSSQNGIVSNSLVYVATGGVSGSQSATVAWPSVSSLISSSNMLSLSQTGLVLSIGQSITITASNLNSSSLYQSSNSNPQIANFSISGSQITVTGNSYGSTTGTFCLISNTSNCSSVYVIVQNSNAQPLTFSQSSISLSSGQTVSIQISGGSGSYSVLNNSSQNNGLVTTSISGSTITLTTTSTTGSSSITVCSANMTSCGIINVTIGNAVSSVISFSQTNPTVTVGQSLNISIFGPTNSLFYVSSSSNPSIVQANLSASTLTLLGIANGSSTINVCVSPSNCGSLTVTVNSNSTNGGALVLSQDVITLSVGQTSSITISGGSMPYNILSTANNIFQPTLNTNILTLYGIGAGSGAMNVCSSYGSCATISVTVINGSSTSILPAGCSSTSGYSQTTGQLCSSMPGAITPVAIPSDCTGALYSISTGQACPTSTITQAAQPAVVSTPTPKIVAAISEFTKSLKLGSTGTEVISLQKKLKTLGFYAGKIDGGFGSATKKAVKAFQKAHKLPQVGSVGPSTRALLNK
ncbi:MAG TPA: peptidoglycan-binding domain-containing protein [Candidatus Paceibacterota bacterium]|nr:peptidoglycan-binding domain-containing protein [Candidatus Paceibacterota bacterium]